MGLAEMQADLAPTGRAAMERDLAPPPKAPKADTHGPLVGGVLDTLGVTDRPGARNPAQVVLNPKGVAEHLASLGVTIPAVALAGEFSPVLPWAARMAASGGFGAASGAAQGMSGVGITMNALLDAALAGGGEAIGAGVRKALGLAAKPAIEAGEKTTERASRAAEVNADRARRVSEKTAERAAEAAKMNADRARRFAQQTAEKRTAANEANTATVRRTAEKTSERAAKASEKNAANIKIAADTAAERGRGFAFATESLEPALNALRERVGHVKSVIIPALSKDPMTLEGAVQKLKTLEGKEYEQAYKEFVDVLNRIDSQRAGTAATTLYDAAGKKMSVGGSPRGPKPYAGDVFKSRTSAERFLPVEVPEPLPVAARQVATPDLVTPKPVPRPTIVTPKPVPAPRVATPRPVKAPPTRAVRAETALPYADVTSKTGGTAQAALDALLTEPVYGVPAGVIAWDALSHLPRGVARRVVPGIDMIPEAPQ